MLRNLRLITFDIVGTVIRFQEPPVAKYVEVAQQFGIKTQFSSLQNSFYSNWRRMDVENPHFGATSDLSSMRWWIILVQNTFKDVLKDEYDEKKIIKVASALYSYYHSPKPYIVMEDGVQTLKRLRADHSARIGVISNFDNRLHDILPHLGLREYIDFTVTSEDAKSSKPESAIFDFAASRSGLEDLKPNQILHVGDDIDKDYVGASRVGWNALLVDRLNGGYSLVEEDHIINNLNQIFDK